MKTIQRASLPLLAVALALGATRVTAEPSPSSGNTELCRTNLILGSGVVVGLQNTGDSLQWAPFTKVALRASLAQLKDQSVDLSIYDRRAAFVTVTARLRTCSDQAKLRFPEKALDLRISAIGDATSLQGGRASDRSPDGARRSDVCPCTGRANVLSGYERSSDRMCATGRPRKPLTGLRSFRCPPQIHSCGPFEHPLVGTLPIIAKSP